MTSLKSIFSNDEVFAHPTEGVWGLGCNPFSSKAVEKLFELKKRPKNKAVIVLAGNKSHIRPFIENLTQSEKKRFVRKMAGSAYLANSCARFNTKMVKGRYRNGCFKVIFTS